MWNLLVLVPILGIPVLLFLGGAVMAASKKQGKDLHENKGCTGCMGIMGAAWLLWIGAGVVVLAQVLI